jgi:hypothetical protein
LAILLSNDDLAIVMRDAADFADIVQTLGVSSVINVPEVEADRQYSMRHRAVQIGTQHTGTIAGTCSACQRTELSLSFDEHVECRCMIRAS